MTQVISQTVAIDAPPRIVWRTLTDPDLMRKWMAEPEVGLEITTDWRVGSSIVVRGFHHVRFENTGIVLRFEPNSILQYSHQSSLSRLPDEPENYSIYTFRLTPMGEDSTSLTVEIANFPTESIFRHVEFYWRVTPRMMRQTAECFKEGSDGCR